MEILDYFNIFAGICSIAGLIVSLVVASKVTKISRSNNNNRGNIHQGDGDQKVAENHSVIGEGTVIHNDYTNAEIIGEIDELPVLAKEQYAIPNVCDQYSFGVSGQICEIVDIGKEDVIIFQPDFSNVQSAPDATRFIGYRFSMLPMGDWRSFVLEDYCLHFAYKSTESIKEMWIEITNKADNIKICKRKLNLSHEKTDFYLSLSKYANMADSWKHVDEICFVFFPEDCIGQKGCVYITGLEICKEHN